MLLSLRKYSLLNIVAFPNHNEIKLQADRHVWTIYSNQSRERYAGPIRTSA